MISRLKAIVRDAIPPAMQVPIKFYLNRWSGRHEPEMALLPHLVGRGDHVIDVGGNRGAYAYRLAQLGGIVEVFEPNPVCYGVLQAWAKGRPAVTIHPIGLSDHDGVVQLRIPIDEEGVEHDASASLEPHPFPRSREQPVDLRTLDSFGFPDVRFIKMDVEGHEYSALRGGMTLIERDRPVLLIEVEQRHLQRPIESVFGLLMDVGYRGWFLDAGMLRPIECFDPSRDQPIDGFDVEGRRYINNFLFLDGAKMAAGRYESMFESKGGAR